ncbi:hypothetical protein BH23ACT5_BH23ACT5_24060 [soil metagenome]
MCPGGRCGAWRARSGGTALSAYQHLRDRLSWPVYRESNALADYGWEAAEASGRMRIISETVREECRALVDLPGWDGWSLDRAV